MEKGVFSTNDAGTAGQQHRKRRSLYTDFIPFTKINSKCIIKPTLHKTEILRRQHRRKQGDLGLGNGYVSCKRVCMYIKRQAQECA